MATHLPYLFNTAEASWLLWSSHILGLICPLPQLEDLASTWVLFGLSAQSVWLCTCYKDFCDVQIVSRMDSERHCLPATKGLEMYRLSPLTILPSTACADRPTTIPLMPPACQNTA